MKKNDTINFLFLILCVLLLGFVYMSNNLPEQAAKPNKLAQETIEQAGALVK